MIRAAVLAVLLGVSAAVEPTPLVVGPASSVEARVLHLSDRATDSAYLPPSAPAELAVHIWVDTVLGMEPLCSGGWVSVGTMRLILTSAHCVIYTEGLTLYGTTDRREYHKLSVVSVSWRKVDQGWEREWDWALLTSDTMQPSLAPKQVVTERPPVGGILSGWGYPMSGDRLYTVGPVLSSEYRIPNSPFDRFVAADLPVWYGSSGTVVYFNRQPVGVVAAIIQGMNVALVSPLVGIRRQ